MAELVGMNQTQGNPYTVRVPSAGEAFRPSNSTTGEVYVREGNQFMATNLESLGQSLFTPTTEKPTYGHLSPAERQALGKQVLQQQGVNYDTIPVGDYNIADVNSYFQKSGSIQPLTDLGVFKRVAGANGGSLPGAPTGSTVASGSLSLSPSTLSSLNQNQQQEFQDVLSGKSSGGVTFGRTPTGVVDLRTGQVVQKTAQGNTISSPESLGVSMQISDLENKIDTQLTNLKAGIGSGATGILNDLYSRFNVAQEQDLVTQYNQEILKQTQLLRKIPDALKNTLSDVGVSEDQYNRLLLKETQKPEEVLRGLMEQKGVAEDAVNNSIKFVSMFADAALKDQATKLELAKYEIDTNKDKLKDLSATQRTVLNAAIDEKKADLIRVGKAQELAVANGADQKIAAYIASASSGDEAYARLAASGFGEKSAGVWSDPYSLGGDIVQKNKTTGEIRTAVNVPKDGVTSGNKPLGILDVARYQDLYPEAGVSAGDTESQANAKVAAVSTPDGKAISIISQAKSTDTYEQVVKDINSLTPKELRDKGLTDKATALRAAKTIYGIKDEASAPKTLLELLTKPAQSGSGLIVTGQKNTPAPAPALPSIAGADFSSDAIKRFGDTIQSYLFK